MMGNPGTPRTKATQRKPKAGTATVSIPTGKRKRAEGRLEDRADYFKKRRGGS